MIKRQENFKSEEEIKLERGILGLSHEEVEYEEKPI
jgi:hypothetical protein